MPSRSDDEPVAMDEEPVESENDWFSSSGDEYPFDDKDCEGKYVNTPGANFRECNVFVMCAYTQIDCNAKACATLLVANACEGVVIEELPDAICDKVEEKLPALEDGLAEETLRIIAVPAHKHNACNALCTGRQPLAELHCLVSQQSSARSRRSHYDFDTVATVLRTHQSPYANSRAKLPPQERAAHEEPEDFANSDVVCTRAHTLCVRLWHSWERRNVGVKPPVHFRCNRIVENTNCVFTCVCVCLSAL